MMLARERRERITSLELLDDEVVELEEGDRESLRFLRGDSTCERGVTAGDGELDRFLSMVNLNWELDRVVVLAVENFARQYR